MITKTIDWKGYTVAHPKKIYPDGSVLCDLDGDTNISFDAGNLPFELTAVETDYINQDIPKKIDGYYVADLDELYAILDTPDEALIEGFNDLTVEEKRTALKEYLHIPEEPIE